MLPAARVDLDIDAVSDAGANGPQQECGKVRVIGGLGFDLAMGAARFGPADRGHA
jgi:hypothetical protein